MLGLWRRGSLLSCGEEREKGDDGRDVDIGKRLDRREIGER